MSTSQRPLGALLLEMGFVDQAQLEAALEEQKRTHKRLGKILIEDGVITEDRLVHALSQQLGIEACDPIMTPVHEAVLAMLPAEVAFRHRILPVARQRDGSGAILYIATADPLDQDAADAVERVVPPQTHARWMLAGETEMDLALARHYGAAPSDGSSRTPAPAPVPQGTPVITGVPVSAPPRRPDDRSHVPLASTGDIFAALQEAVELASPALDHSEPDGSDPDEATHESQAVELPGPNTSNPSIDLARLQGKIRDEVSQEIIAAEEVIESGVHSPEDLEPDHPASGSNWPPVVLDSPESSPDSSASDLDLGVAPAEEEEEEPASVASVLDVPVVEGAEMISSGPSWGDLVGADDDDDVDMELVMEEAAELPSATNSVPSMPPQAGPEAVHEAVTTVPGPAELAPISEDLLDADTAESTDDTPPPEERAPRPRPLTPFAAPSMQDASLLDLSARHLSDPDIDPSALDATLDPEMDPQADDPFPRALSSDQLLGLPMEDAVEVPDGPDEDDHGANGRAPARALSGRASPEEIRAMMRRFVAGGPVTEAQRQWILRVLAAVALEQGQLDDARLEPILARVGPPPE